MKRFNTDIIWSLISDFFADNINNESRRLYEAMWQAMASSTAEAVEYADYYKRAKSPFYVDAYAPYGNFSAKPYLVDIESSLSGTVLGYRDGYWVVYSEESLVVPKRGSIRVGNKTYSYTMGTSRNLNSGGSLHYLKSDESSFPWGLVDNPSFAFGNGYSAQRWDASGGSRLPEVVTHGLLMSNEWVNWFVLSDNYFMDGSSSWRQKWLFRVIDWDATSSLRSLSVNIFGDSGPGYEARLEDRSGVATGKFGLFALTKNTDLVFSGSTITRARGSWIGDGFVVGMNVVVSGTTSNDTNTMLVTGVTPTTLTVDKSLGTESVSTARILNSLSGGDGDSSSWRATLNSASASNPVYVEIVVEYDAVTGNLQSVIYVNDMPVSQSAPYKSSPGRKKIVVDFFNQYKTSALILDSVYSTGSTWESVSSYDLTTEIGEGYKFIYQLEAPLIDASKLSIAPWDLSPDATITSISSGTISLEVSEDYNNYQPTHSRISGDNGAYAICSKISDGEYSIVSSAGDLEYGEVKLSPWFTFDFEFISPGLFSTKSPLPISDGETIWFRDAKGVELDMYNRYGKLLGVDRADDSIEYLDIIRGVQYGLMTPATKYHMANSIDIIMGAPYSLNGGRIASISRVRDELGSPLYDQVIIGTESFNISTHWKDSGVLKVVGQYVNPMESLVDTVSILDYRDEAISTPWENWGTFYVKVPSTLGTTPFRAKSAIDMINRSKSVHNTFLLNYVDSQSEKLFADNSSWSQNVVAHSIEDMVFDDHGEVFMNSLKYQTISAVNYSEEYQLEMAPNNLDEGGFLDYSEISLDGTLTKPNPVDGSSDYSNESLTLRPDPEYNKSPIRLLNIGAHPYSIIWAYEDGTSVVSSYSPALWFDRTPSPAAGVTLRDATESTKGDRILYISGDSGVIYKSINYGQSWSQESVSGSVSNFTSISGDVALQNQNGKLWKNNGSIWAPLTPSAFSAGYDLDFVSCLDSDNYAIVCSSGGDLYLSTSTDGGTVWSIPALIAPTKTASYVSRYANNIAVATDAGLLVSQDGGSSWSAHETGVAFDSVLITATHIIAFSGTTLYRSTYPLPSFSTTAAPAGIVDDCTGVSGYGDIIYAVTASAIIKSDDSGASWSDDTPSISSSMVNVLAAKKNRIAFGGADETWIKL